MNSTESTRRRTSIVRRTFRLLLLSVSTLVVLWAVLGGAQPAYSQGSPPTATVSVWNITAPIGHNPDVSREDVMGVTAHVNTAANPLSIAVAIDNSNNPQGPCGLIFWNPATNNFVDYGIGGGFADGIDINFNAPPLTGPSGGVFGAPTFQPGDTWETISGSPPLFVNFKGSNNFRFYTVGSGGVRGVRVDPSSGKIFFADSTGGTLNRLDPSTNTVTTWVVGGNPYYLTLDGSGNVFATVAGAGVTGSAIVELTPGSGQVKAWPIPGGGLASGFVGLAANGIALDSAGNVWFGESASNEVGRLNPGSNEICKFTQAGSTASPQQVASSGSGSTLQAFYTEAGAGSSGSDLHGAVSVLTQASAVPEVSPCPMPTPTVVTVTPSTSTASFADSVRTPRFNTITPSVTTVTGTSTPGIVRFPMPFPTGGTTTAPNAPSGMTGVALPGTVLGSYQDTSFTSNSAVFEVQSPVITAPPPTQTQTKTLGPPGTTTPYTFNTDTYTITGSDNAGGETMTVTIFLTPQSAFPSFTVTNKTTGFTGTETCIPFSDYSASAGVPTCGEFQTTCKTQTGADCQFHYTTTIFFPNTPAVVRSPDFLVFHGINRLVMPTDMPVSIFDAYLLNAPAPDPTDVGCSLGPSVFIPTHVPGGPATTPVNSYAVGLYAPIAGPPMVNDAEAGAALPVLFQVNSATGPVTPTTTPTLTYCDPLTSTSPCGANTVTIQFFPMACGAPGSTSTTGVAASSAGSSGLQFNTPGTPDAPPNSWQFNAKPPGSFAGTCQELRVAFPTGVSGQPGQVLRALFSLF